MANNCNRDSDSDDTTSSHHPVFIDTNLDTHLALIVSGSDTVSVLKKKIMSEHPQCFPNSGEIKIIGLKVKRKGRFYHLSDSILVKSVFERVKKCWFVYVDAFSLKEHDDNQFPIEPAVNNQLALVCFTKTPSGDLYTLHSGTVKPEYDPLNTIKDVLNHAEMSNMGVGGEHCNTSVLDTNERSDLGEPQGTHVECHNDKSRNTNGDVHWNDSLVDGEHSKSKPVAKKKRKRESKGDGKTLEENKILFTEAISMPKDRILQDSIEYKLKTTSTTSDSLFTEPPDLVAISSCGSKKSTLRNNLLRDQVVTAKPSSLLDVGKGILKENGGIVAKTSNNVFDTTIASEENMQHAKLLGTFKVSQKQKHPESVKEVVKRDKLHSLSAGSLLTELPEDLHLVASSGSGRKKNKNKKLPTDQVVNPEPSSLHAAGKESFKKNVRVANNSDKVSDAAIVDEENMQHAKFSGTFEVFQKQKPRESIQEVLEQDRLPSSAAGSSCVKKNKKKKLSTDVVVNEEPSSLFDIGKECSKENVAIASKEDSDKAIDAVIVSEENVQHATLLGDFKVSQTEKKPEPVREVVERNKLPSSSVDSLFTEPPEDGRLVAGCTSGKNKSKKKKLSTDQVVNPEPSSLRDVGKEGSKENEGTVFKDSDKSSGAVIVSEQSVQCATLSGTFKLSKKQKLPEPVQEVVERDKLPSSSPGIDASRSDATNEKWKNSASESGARSGSKARKTSKKHHSTNVEEFPLSAVNEHSNMNKDDICSRHENIDLDDHNVETSHPHKSEERRELPQNHDPEAALSEKHETLIHGESNMHSKESIISTNLLESNIVGDSGKPASSRRMKVSARKFVSTKHVMSCMDDDDNAASGTSLHIPPLNDYSNGEAKKVDNFLSPTGWKVTSKRKTLDTSFVGANGKNDVCGNEAESLPLTQVHKTQKNSEIDVSLSKKAKNTETSDADFPVKEQASNVESLQKNQVGKNAEDIDGKSRKKTKKSQKCAAESLSDLPIREQEVGVEVLNPPTDRLRDISTPSKIKRKIKSVKTSSIGQFTVQELEPGTNHGSLNPQQTSRTVDFTQVPSSDILISNSIVRPLQNNDDDNPSKNSNTTNANYQREVSKCDDDVNFKDYFVREERMHKVTPIELIVDNVSEAKGSDRKVKTEKNAKKVVLPSPSTSHGPENSLNSYVNQGSDRRSHEVSKASDKKMGKAVNSSQHEKSLLATPGAIFRDGSSESSEEESQIVNSDSSTKTPSDNSSSSGYSEGDNKLNLDSPRNGIDGAKEKDGGKSITKSQAFSSKNVTLDTILRSSSRFKKAKLTASQSQLEDVESQAVDFVPDSQGNL